jgi:hypothetical protein
VHGKVNNPGHEHPGCRQREEVSESIAENVAASNARSLLRFEAAEVYPCHLPHSVAQHLINYSAIIAQQIAALFGTCMNSLDALNLCRTLNTWRRPGEGRGDLVAVEPGRRRVTRLPGSSGTTLTGERPGSGLFKRHLRDEVLAGALIPVPH